MDTDNPLFRVAKKKREYFDVVQREANKALAAYYGGEALKEYIPQYSGSEDDGSFRKRRAMAVNHYDNFVKLIIAMYVEGAFASKQDSRETKDETFNAFLSGKYYKWLVNEFAPFAIHLPEIFVMMEKPASTINPVNVADDSSAEMLPRQYMIFPQHVINYEQDIDGRINWISYRRGEDVLIIDHEETLVLGKGGRKKNLVNRDGIAVNNPFKHGYTDDEENKICPVLKFEFEKNYHCNGQIGHSFTAEVTNKSVANLTFVSMFIEMVVIHLSQKLVMSTGTIQTYPDSINVGNTEIIEESTEGITAAGNIGTTRYLDLPSAPFEIIYKILTEFSPDGIFRAARLRLVKESGESGIAKLVNMLPEAKVLARIIDYIWQCDEAMVNMAAQGYAPTLGKPKDRKISYPSVVDVRTTAEQMTDITALVTNMATGKVPYSMTFNIALMKKWYRQILPELSKAERDKGDKELTEFVEQGEPPVTVMKQLEDGLNNSKQVPAQPNQIPNQKPATGGN